tara:strand:+ start:3194 stop:3967 length:774 start_codon:yes stop_codon:yes gene_type:complete
MLELPTFVMPEKEIQQINVKLVSAPSKASKDVPAAKPKPQVSQQSAAPKYAPKKQKEVKQEVKHKTKVVKKQKSKKVVKKKKQEPKKAQKKQQKQKKQEAKKSAHRPEKLDKTQKKKSVVKSNDKKAKPAESIDDDFLSTLDFIDDLDTNEKPSIKSDEEGEASVYDIDQIEIAKIQRLVQSNWYVTAGANRLEKKEAIVRLSLDRDGTVRKVKVIKSSGYGHFDRSLQRAIRKSSPLPIPADKYEIYKTIELRFRR